MRPAVMSPGPSGREDALLRYLLPVDDDAIDPHAERREARRERARKGMQVSNRSLKTVQLELDAQRRRNAERGLGPVTDAEARRPGGPEGPSRA
jgi:hypothetical protein